MNIQEIKNYRKRAVVAFTKFCQDKELHGTHLFCFFEGEDYKYYSHRLERFTSYDLEHIIQYHCGGRREVLKVYELIKNEESYIEVKKAFFVDSDYIPIKDLDAYIYQTPCYSIENFYSSPSCFGKILNVEFGVNVNSEDYEKCQNDYENTFKDIHEKVLLLNAWLYCQRHYEHKMGCRNIPLSDFKIITLFSHVQIDSVICKKNIDISFLKELFPESYDIPEEELNAVIDNFRVKNHYYLFRGKFELEFVQRILEDLRSKNENGGYFSERLKCIRLEVRANPLSTLSGFADTPDDLKDFLKRYKYA